MIQDHAGAVGTGTFAATGFAGFMAAATPVLQFLCLVISFVVGVLTVAWYVRRLRKDS